MCVQFHVISLKILLCCLFIYYMSVPLLSHSLLVVSEHQKIVHFWFLRTGKIRFVLQFKMKITFSVSCWALASLAASAWSFILPPSSVSAASAHCSHTTTESRGGGRLESRSALRLCSWGITDTHAHAHTHTHTHTHTNWYKHKTWSL